MKYINKRLDRFDTDIEYHFNDILDKIKEELYNDIETIFNTNNSIIGKYFLWIILEAYKCDKCNKIIERKNSFNILDIDYKGIVNALQNKDILFKKIIPISKLIYKFSIINIFFGAFYKIF